MCIGKKSLYLGWVIWKVADYVLDLFLVYANYCLYLDAKYMVVYANYCLSIDTRILHM